MLTLEDYAEGKDKRRWCIDCQEAFRPLKVDAVGTVILGCFACWKKLGFRGLPPSNAAPHGRHAAASFDEAQKLSPRFGAAQNDFEAVSRSLSPVSPRQLSPRAKWPPPSVEDRADSPRRNRQGPRQEEALSPRNRRRSCANENGRMQLAEEAARPEQGRTEPQSPRMRRRKLVPSQLEIQEMPPGERKADRLSLAPLAESPASRSRVASKEQSLTKITSLPDIHGTDAQNTSEKLLDIVAGKVPKPKLRDALDRLIRETSKNNSSMTAVFRQLDTDMDGVISRDEMQVGLRRLGVFLLPGERDIIMRVFDVDGNGSVDYDDFSLLLSKYELQMQGAGGSPEGRQSGAGNAMHKPYTVGTRVRAMFMLPGVIDTASCGIVVAEGGTPGTYEVHFKGVDRPKIVKANQIKKIEDSKPRRPASASRMGSLL